jgi:hypothetical protein
MRRFHLKERILSTILAGTLGMGFSFAVLPVPQAHADILGAILTGVKGAAVYTEADKALRYYNETEEGRQKLLANYKEKYGVNEDPDLNGQLTNMMNELTSSIGAVDATIYDKPYLYFINNEKTFNAFCSMGHVMSVNTGMYSMTSSPDEIAVVLLHEMGHGQKDHVVTGARKRIKVVIAAGMLGEAAGGGMSDVVLNVLVNQIDNVQIGRHDEWAADDLALTYMLHSNYNFGATAALWQRVMERSSSSGTSFVGEIFSPSDHPTHKQRRDHYAERLSDLSGGNVTCKDGVVKVSGKDFVTPAAAGGMSAKERSYFVMGNLVAAYMHQENLKEATSDGSTVYLGNQPIMTCTSGDPDAAALAQKLNAIKDNKVSKIPSGELEIEKEAAPAKK